MKEINHPNIIQLITYFYTSGSIANENYLNLVMEMQNENLANVIKHYKKVLPKVPMILI